MEEEVALGSSRANVISVDRGDEVVKLVDTNEIYRIKSINEECREILGESLGKRIRYTTDMQKLYYEKQDNRLQDNDKIILHESK